MNSLHALLPVVGKLATFKRHQDSVSVETADGWILIIYCNYRIEGGKNLTEWVDSVSTLEAGESSLMLHVESGVLIRINLSDAAFNGPEAMVLAGPSNEVIVWN